MQRERHLLILLVVVGFVFFFLYRWLYSTPFPDTQESILHSSRHLIFNQPDESVNYFFIRQFVFEGSIRVPEQLTDAGLQMVHPRSTTIVQGSLVPIGFPGVIVIFGFIIKFFVLLFGQSAFNVLAVSFTPLLGVLTAIAFYGFVGHIVQDRWVARWSGLLLLVMPTWWYYASRPMQHHTLLLFLFILALYAWMRLYRQESRQGLSAFYWTLLWGLAIYVRPSELVWMGSLFCFSVYTLRHVLKQREILYALLGFGIAVTLFFGTQDMVYGSLLGSGYVRPTDSGLAGTILDGPQGIPILQAIFFPFGFDGKTILKNAYHYLIGLWPLWAMVLGSGLFMMGYFRVTWDRKKFRSKRQWQVVAAYAVIYVIVSAYIISYYGSWKFSDNLVGIASIASSHARYFLPVQVFVLPVIAWLLTYLWKKGIYGKMIAGGVLGLLLVQSAYAVYTPLEGLMNVKETVRSYYDRQERILDITPKHAILVTRYADKYIFPHRRVIPGIESDERERRIAAIAQLLRTERRSIYRYDLALTLEGYEELQTELTAAGVSLGDVIAAWDGLEIRQFHLIE